MILFPSCLAFMAKMVRPMKDQSARFSGSLGVEIRRFNDSVRVAATDMHTLFVVDAKPAHDQYPEPPGVVLAGDELRAITVPAADFAAACKAVEKLTRKDTRTGDGVLRNVCATVAGPAVTRLMGYSTATGEKVETVTQNERGQFPPVSDYLVRVHNETTVAETWVDPVLLARALEGMAALGVTRVKLELKKADSGAFKDTPPKVVLTAEGEMSQGIYSAEAVVQPLG